MKLEKKYIILIAIVLFPLLLLGIYYLIHTDDPVKTTKSRSNSKLPQIEIESTDTNAANEYLEELYDKYAKGKNKFNYEYMTNDDILSLLVKIEEYDEDEDLYTKKFKSFNLVKSSGKYIDKESLFNLFNYELSDITKIVNERLKKYYDEEYEQGYVDYECEFECYKSYQRGIVGIYDIIEPVIEDGKLVIYLNLSIDSMSGDSEYFESLDYNPYKIVIE